MKKKFLLKDFRFLRDYEKWISPKMKERNYRYTQVTENNKSSSITEYT